MIPGANSRPPHGIAQHGYGMWLQLVGRDPVTGWRWAKAGVVQTENVFGRPFITSDEIKRFWARVKLGEFAREAKVPRKTAKTAN